VVEEPGEEPQLYRQDTGELVTNNNFTSPIVINDNKEHLYDKAFNKARNQRPSQSPSRFKVDTSDNKTNKQFYQDINEIIVQTGKDDDLKAKVIEIDDLNSVASMPNQVYTSNRGEEVEETKLIDGLDKKFDDDDSTSTSSLVIIPSPKLDQRQSKTESLQKYHQEQQLKQKENDKILDDFLNEKPILIEKLEKSEVITKKATNRSSTKPYQKKKAETTIITQVLNKNDYKNVICSDNDSIKSRQSRRTSNTSNCPSKSEKKQRNTNLTRSVSAKSLHRPTIILKDVNKKINKSSERLFKDETNKLPPPPPPPPQQQQTTIEVKVDENSITEDISIKSNNTTSKQSKISSKKSSNSGSSKLRVINLSSFRNSSNRLNLNKNVNKQTTTAAAPTNLNDNLINDQQQPPTVELPPNFSFESTKNQSDKDDTDCIKKFQPASELITKHLKPVRTIRSGGRANTTIDTKVNANDNEIEPKLKVKQSDGQQQQQQQQQQQLVKSDDESNDSSEIVKMRKRMISDKDKKSAKNRYSQIYTKINTADEQIAMKTSKSHQKENENEDQQLKNKKTKQQQKHQIKIITENNPRLTPTNEDHEERTSLSKNLSKSIENDLSTSHNNNKITKAKHSKKDKSINESSTATNKKGIYEKHLKYNEDIYNNNNNTSMSSTFYDELDFSTREEFNQYNNNSICSNNNNNNPYSNSNQQFYNDFEQIHLTSPAFFQPGYFPIGKNQQQRQNNVSPLINDNSHMTAPSPSPTTIPQTPPPQSLRDDISSSSPSHQRYQKNSNYQQFSAPYFGHQNYSTPHYQQQQQHHYQQHQVRLPPNIIQSTTTPHWYSPQQPSFQNDTTSNSNSSTHDYRNSFYSN
jgi:hypothetical protein